MAQELINVGTVPNDRTGDPLRDAFIKCNDNFSALFGVTPTGYVSVTITVASTDNYNPGSGWPTGIGRLDVNPSTVNSTLTGLVAGTDGQQVMVRNVGTFNLVLTNESASSTAANRFTGQGSSTIVPGGQLLLIYYSSPNPRWSMG